MPTAPAPAPDVYAIIVQCLPRAQFSCKLLNRAHFPTCVCELSPHQKTRVAVAVGDILRVDPTDYDRDERGTGAILEVIHDAKEIKRLRKSGAIPDEDAMPVIPSKEHHHSKRDKPQHHKQHDSTSMTEEDAIKLRNQPPAPAFDDEADAIPEDMIDHPAMREEEDEELLADKKKRGAHLTKSEKHALKLESKAQAAHDELESALAERQNVDLDSL